MQKFKFIGGLPNTKYNKSFVVEISDEEWNKIKQFPYPKFMSGTVVESKNKDIFVGEYKTNFCNPYYEMNYCGWPVFVRIWG